MNVSFGLIDGLQEKIRDKAKRYEAVSARALDALDALNLREGVMA